jgi:hypothetical protein
MAIQAWSARDSKVMVDSHEVTGLQSIEFKEDRSRRDIQAIGESLRQGVEYGVRVINGTLRVQSSCKPLEEKLQEDDLEKAKFTLVAQLKKGDQTLNINFQDCYLDNREFTMDVNGVGVAVYSFSATNVDVKF